MARRCETSDISDMDGDTLRARLRERLDATGKKPIPLARELGKGRDYLTDILNGKKDSLSSDTLTALAIALECDERYFTDDAFSTPGRARRAATEEDLARYEDASRAHGWFTLAWREYRRQTLAEVAEGSGLTPGTVSDVENGLREPTPEQLAALARALSTNPGSLSTNPFLTNERVARLVSLTEGLDPDDQLTLLDMAASFERRRVG